MQQCPKPSIEGNSSGAVLSGYREQLQAVKEKLQAAQASRKKSLFVSVVLVLAFAVILGIGILHAIPLLPIVVIPACLAGVSVQRYMRAGELWRKLDCRCEYLEAGIRRLSHAWQGIGNDGLEYHRAQHLYQEDLDVLGSGSLFEFLCTTRSSAGAERLASYLLDAVPLEEIRFRQEAVRELRDGHALREQIHDLGRHRFQDCSAVAIKTWLDAPPLQEYRAIPALLLASSATSMLLAVAIWSGVLLWTHWLSVLVLLCLLQLAICGGLFRVIRPRLQILRPLTGAFSILREGLALMERQQFHSSKLQAMVEQLRTQKASLHTERLERLFQILEQREKTELYLPALLLSVGTQSVIAIERWRGRFGKHLESWVNIWAEFEALQSLAGYGYEHSDWAFPEIVKGTALFEASQLGHPLLPNGKCVGNNVALGGESRAYIISGSNMAGKSTLLRAIGVNAVLAMAGAPVRAASLRLSRLSLCASLAITDSLLGGKSKFLAEVERLREMVEAVRASEPVLFLIDEILSGTNSQDRKVASELILKTLLDGGAVGALSTHDLALTEIARDPNVPAVLVHMTNVNADDPLSFDHRLRPGISRKTNALAIVKMMGITGF